MIYKCGSEVTCFHLVLLKLMSDLEDAGGDDLAVRCETLLGQENVIILG
jgi:hypothetical protein